MKISLSLSLKMEMEMEMETERVAPNCCSKVAIKLVFLELRRSSKVVTRSRLDQVAAVNFIENNGNKKCSAGNNQAR